MYKSPYLRGQSASKLPPILKAKPSSNMRHRQRIKEIDFSLELVQQNARPRILSNGSNPRIVKGKKNIINKATSSRHRTQRMVAEIQQKLSSFEAYTPQLHIDNNPEITLQNFHRNVKLNKEYIHRQIKRRRQQKCKQSKQNLNELKQPKQKQMIHKTERESKKILRNKQQSDSEETAIFGEIQQILNSKIVKKGDKKQGNQEDKLEFNGVRHIIKMNRINQNIRKLSPGESPARIRDSYVSPTNLNSSRVVLKDENNYHEWRRVEISPGKDSPTYKQSTYQLQNQRLQQFVLKNQISLSKYLEYRKQLHVCQSTKVKTSIN